MSKFAVKAYDNDMKKTLSAFVAGLVVASVPYLLLTRADAQGAGPVRAGAQGGFQGGPAQLPPGQGLPGQGGFQQGPPAIQTLTSDNDYVYAGAGNWLYKVRKSDMAVEKRVALTPPVRQERPGRPDGNGG